jgi:hypothetical protein
MTNRVLQFIQLGFKMMNFFCFLIPVFCFADSYTGNFLENVKSFEKISYGGSPAKLER